jgi:hypothetical protein
MADTITGRNLARQAGAAKLGGDYIDAEEAFLSLTKAIEKGNLAYAEKNKAEISKTFLLRKKRKSTKKEIHWSFV